MQLLKFSQEYLHLQHGIWAPSQGELLKLEWLELPRSSLANELLSAEMPSAIPIPLNFSKPLVASWESLPLAGLAAEAMVVLEVPAAAMVEPWLPILPQKPELS